MARLFVEANAQRLEGSFINVVHPITMCCWFYDTSGAANDRNMMQIQDNTNTQKQYRLGASGSGDDVRVSERGANGSFERVDTSTQYSTNVWNHALGVWLNQNSRTAYLNGGGAQTDTNNSGDTPEGIQSISIGQEGDSSPSDEWEGRLAECAVWNVALTLNEIQALAAGYSPALIIPSALIFYAPVVQGNSSGDDKAIAGLNAGICLSVADP